MFKLNKWYLTRSLPAFRDSESFTILEQTYKLWQAMEQFETEYNSFVDSFNNEWELFETKYNGDIETFTLAMRQEFADFIEVADVRISNIETLLKSDDVNLDTLQELVNALKNNVSSINDLFTELSKKANKEETIRVINQDISYNTIENLYNSYGETFIAYIGYYGHYAFVSIKSTGSSLYNVSVSSSIYMVNGVSVEGTTAILTFVNNPTNSNTYSNSKIDSMFQPKLTAGEGITIENNVISAGCGGSSSQLKLVATGTPFTTSVGETTHYNLDNELEENKLYLLQLWAGYTFSTFIQPNVCTPFVGYSELGNFLSGVCHCEVNRITLYDINENIPFSGVFENVKVYELPFTL